MKRNIFIILLLCIPYCVFSQKSTLDSVMVKFRTDKRALEEFKVLGKMYFTEKVIGNNDIYFQTYSSLYNGRSPFVRLIDEDELKRTFNLIIDSQNMILGLQRDSSNFYNTNQSYYYFILKKIIRYF